MVAAAVLPPTPALFRWENDGSDNGEVKAPPRQPSRQRPSFLSDETAGPRRGPRRQPPQRSKGFHEGVNSSLSLHRVPLTPIEFLKKDDGPHVRDGSVARILQDIVVSSPSSSNNNTNNKVTVVFAIRVAGCGQCREHGIQLSEIFEDQQERVNVMGVVKETGVDDEALLEYYTDYFNFPLYKDQGMHLYNVIGNHKLDTFTLLERGQRMHQRVEAKGIREARNGVKGESLTQGGVLVFDKAGKLRYVYYESFGHELDTEAIQWAVEEASKGRQ